MQAATFAASPLREDDNCNVATLGGFPELTDGVAGLNGVVPIDDGIATVGEVNLYQTSG